jgi:integrase
MSYQTHYLQKRGFSLSFRIAIPEDLRPIIGTREFVKALPTQDHRIAGPIALSLAAQAKRLFIRLRGMANRNTPQSESLDFGYTLECDLDESGMVRRVKIQAEPHEQAAVDSAICAAIESGATARQKTQTLPAHASPTENRPVAPKSSPTPTFKTVVDDFLVKYEKRNKPGMLKKHKMVLPMLLNVVGDKPISDIRQADINGFFDLLDKLPPRWGDACRKQGLSLQQLSELDHDVTLGPRSFDDTYLASVRPFLKSAKKDWQDQGFPLGLTTEGIEYIGDREEDENKQRPFTLPELQRLFEGNEMGGYAADENLAHCFWLPHVGLFTGARVNEICQLNPQTDILQDPSSGTWYFWITKDTEADKGVIKSVKTGDSRKVPIHSKLIELGFLDYVEQVKVKDGMRLFPAWEPINKRASGEAEKWFRKLLRQTKLRDETPKAKILGMHAFRHTLLTHGAMRKPPLNLTSITGHAQNPVGATGAARGYFDLALLNTLPDGKALLDQLNYKIEFHMPVKSITDDAHTLRR